MKTIVILISFLLVACTGFACDSPDRYDHHNSDVQYNQHYNSVTGKQTPIQYQSVQPVPVRQFTARECWDTCQSHQECKACRTIESRERNEGTYTNFSRGTVKATENTRDIIEGGAGAVRSSTRLLENLDRLEEVLHR